MEQDSTQPLIGIPSFLATRAGNQRPLVAMNERYVRAIEASGGMALLIPPRGTEPATTLVERICARLDGLLLAGGGDVDPTRYGQVPSPLCGLPETERDAMELALARKALAMGLPILAICRGMQLLNVALGGTVQQDIASALPAAHPHDWHHAPRDHRAHSVTLDGDCRLADIVGARELLVNSLHHQAVDQPGQRARVVGRSPDGIAEALEVSDHPFAVAVQYHPEELFPTDSASQQLFSAFVSACADYAESRVSASVSRAHNG